MLYNSKQLNYTYSSQFKHIYIVLYKYKIRIIILFKLWRMYMDDITILVVDDESRIRKLLKDFLGKENANVIEACDGEDALEKFEEKIFSLFS